MQPTTITMTSDRFKGSLIFRYNESGHLASFTSDTVLTSKQQELIASAFPWTLELAKVFMHNNPSATYLVQEDCLTFDMFWNKYNDKVRSSRKKTLKKWNSMAKTEQAKAYFYVPRYFKSMGTAEKKYATTYLNDELWNN